MNIDLSKLKVGQKVKDGHGVICEFEGPSKETDYPFMVSGWSYAKDGTFSFDDRNSDDNIVEILPLEPSESNPTPMRFESNCAESIEQVQAIFTQRGAEYAGTWGEAKWVTIIAAAKSIGVMLTNEQARLLVAAGLYDVKYWRNLGGLKEDNVLDGIAYGLNFLAEMKGGSK